MKKSTIQIGSIMQLQSLRLYILLLFVFGINRAHAQDSQTDLFPEDSSLTKLSSNQFMFTEGPVWYRDSVLLFTDGDANTSEIYGYDPMGQQFSVFRNNAEGCNGLTCDRAGNLLACQSDTKSIVMMNKDGIVIETLAGIYNGNPFNGPNDLIADAKGGVYFSDPVYFVTPTQDKEAVYYIDSTRNVKRVIDDLAKPNGLVLSPDGTKLYVVDSDNKYIYSWDVAADGSLSGKSNLAILQTTGGVASGADGMAIDINGNIYVASDKGIQIFTSQGVAISTITVPEIPSNCDFGGKDFKTLYITARKNIYRINLNYTGYAVSRKGGANAINSVPNTPSVEMHPNPVSDILYIQHNLDRVNSLEIFNMDGKKESTILNKEGVTGIELSTQNLEPGMYLIRIVYNKGIVTKRFVKE